MTQPMLVITEIMLHPLHATNQSTQWFEVYNAGNETLNLEYAMWVACHRRRRPTKGSTKMTCDYIAVECSYDATHEPLIAANEYLVIGNNDDMKTNGNISVDILFNFQFPNDGSGFNYISSYADRRRQRRLNGELYDDHDRWFEEDTVLWTTDPPDDFYVNYPFVPGASLAKINATEYSFDISPEYLEALMSNYESLDGYGPYHKRQIVSNWQSSVTPIHSCDSACDDSGDKGTPGRINDKGSPGRIGGSNAVTSQRLASPNILLLLLPLLLILILRSYRPKTRPTTEQIEMDQIEMKDMRQFLATD